MCEREGEGRGKENYKPNDMYMQTRFIEHTKEITTKRNRQHAIIVSIMKLTLNTERKDYDSAELPFSSPIFKMVQRLTTRLKQVEN